MAISLFGRIRTPAGNQKVAVAADLKKMADDIDQQLNLKALNENDRNTRYQNVKAGTKVVTEDGWEWVKTSNPPDAPTWKTLHSGAVYTGFSWTNGFEDAGDSAIVQEGEHYDLMVSAIYNGTDLIGPGGPEGGLDDVRICQITDPNWRPWGSRPFIVHGGGSFGGHGICYGSTGTVNITHTYPGADLNPGDVATLAFNWNKRS